MATNFGHATFPAVIDRHVRRHAETNASCDGDLFGDDDLVCRDGRLADLLGHVTSQPWPDRAQPAGVRGGRCDRSGRQANDREPRRRRTSRRSGPGNLEGKELRFGTSAGATFAAITTAVTCGSVNCMHDSLIPLAGITLLTGMWLNCVYGASASAW